MPDTNDLRWITVFEAEERFGGGGGGSLLSATVTLTDDQIKALPTTGIEVVPAQGANTIIKAISGFVILDNTAAPYTADPVNASLSLLYGGVNQAEASIPLLTSTALTGTNATPVVGEFGIPSIGLGSGDFDGEIISFLSIKTLSNYTNQPLLVQDFWDGVDDYTGGDAANTMKVIVYYTVVDLS